MSIKSTTFGRVELSGEDAHRFIKHMNEPRKANKKAQRSLKRGRTVLATIKQ